MPQVSLGEMASALTASPVLVSFPTDTVPALATAPTQAGLIFAAKRRPPEKPLILMGASFEDLCLYIKGDERELEIWRSQTQQHWPGQLTLVLPASDHAPTNLNPLSTGTLGIRVPNHPIALQLLRQTGPLATTSANLSGQPPLTTAADISSTFPIALTLAPEYYRSSPVSSQRATQASDLASTQESGQATASGQPSTVAQWSPTGWQILRQGKVHL